MGTTSTETVTRTELVELALRQLGNSDPSNDEKAKAVIVLNAMLKQLDPEAHWTWTSSFSPDTLTTVASQRNYSTSDGVEANIFKIISADRVSGTSLIPIEVIDTMERLTTLDREGTGTPAAIYLRRAPTLAAQTIDLLPTPNGVYSIQYTYQRRLYDFTAASDNPDMPGEWNYSLAIMLADKMSREYGLPLDFRQDLKLDAENEKRKLIAANSGDAYVPVMPVDYY